MKELVILIPGNPSVPGIYDDFLAQVANELAPTAESVFEILPHLGQCNRKVPSQKSASVFDVIDDHRNSIQKLIKTHKADRVVLIGHSLGSAVSIYLHEELKDVVDHFVILCPFVGPAENNVSYLKMFQNPVSRLGMIGLTHTLLLYPKVSRYFFKRWLGDNPYNEHIPRQIKQKPYLRYFFSLVSTYIDDFEKLKIKQRLSRMDPHKSFYVFANKDYWVPDEVKKSLPDDANFVTCEDIQHDFCLFEPQYKRVSNVIRDRLR